MRIKLTRSEMALLLRQDPSSRKTGGFQSLLVSLGQRINRKTGEIDLTDLDLERIARYAFKYQNGGWESRLVSIFRRELGPDLSGQDQAIERTGS